MTKGRNKKCITGHGSSSDIKPQFRRWYIQGSAGPLTGLATKPGNILCTQATALSFCKYVKILCEYIQGHNSAV